jgi:serine/threonine-protein kinase
MDAARWEQLQAIFLRTVDLPAGAQRAALDAACGSDEDLKTAVLELLEADARTGGAVDGDLAEVAGDVLDSPWSLSPASDRFGPYRIVEMIKEGGMGVVYLGERTDVGQRVAIKVLRDAWVSPSRRARFAIEQRTLARLSHPSIARLYDVDTLDEGTPFFVMEYVDGVPITEHCRARGCSIAERLALLRGVCVAVQHAHRQLIVHRDLKPSNVLVTADGEVKLLDFGISKEVDALTGSVDQTQIYRMLTPRYAAPEQHRGEEVGVYTDVYALGVMLYELLAGSLPPENPAASAVVASIAPPAPSVVGATQPWGRPLARSAWTDLDVLCATAMHHDIGRRYATVDALIRDIDHYTNRQPLDARPDGWRYRAHKFVSRHATGVAATIAVAAMIAGLVGFYTFRLASARNAAVAEAARTQRIQQFMLNLFDAGDPDVAPASEMKVLTLVDRGVQEARALDRDPAIQAALFETLGTVYQGLGEFDRADGLLRQAVDQQRRLPDADQGDVADSLVSLGLSKLAQAKFSEAEQLINEGLQIGSRSLPRTHPSVARATAARGKAIEAQGAYARAIPILEDAVRLYTAGGNAPLEISAAMTELANTHFYAGHLDEAEALNRQVLEMDRRLRGSGHPHVADDLLNIAAIESSRGRHGEAERLDREAVDILTAWYGADHPETASAMTILAQALTFQRRQLDEAATLLRRALATQERVYGPAHPRVGFVLNEIGNVAMQQQAFDEAEAAFARSLAVNRAAYPDGRHFRIGVALSNLGGAVMARGDYARAEPLLRESVAVLTAAQSAQHVNTANAHVKLGRTLLHLNRAGDAEPELLAGYRVLAAKPGASPTWLRAAREDLAAADDALGRPDQARRYRDELAAAAAPQGH